MVRCNRCGTANEFGARFCVGCGNALGEEAPKPFAAPPAAYPDARQAGSSGQHSGVSGQAGVSGQHGAAYAAPPGAQPPPAQHYGQPGPGAYPPPGAYAPAGPGAYQPPPGASPLPPAAMPHGAVPHGAVPPGGQPPPGALPPGVQPQPYGGGNLPAWPGAPGQDALGGYQPAGARPQGVAAAQALAYAETSPPIYDEQALNRPLPDRGRRRGPPDDRGTDVPPPHVRPVDPAPVGSFDPMNVPREAPRILVGFLVSFESNPLGQFWPLFQGPNLIGRLGAGVGADIELPHATVSSRHALLHASFQPGRVVVVDQASTNGTYVNEAPLTQEQPRELRDGDRVRLGLYSLVIKILH